MKSDVKVGIFVFIGMLLLFFLTTQVGSFKNYGKEGYKLYANLENAAGLEKNSKVKANGIDVGYIDSLEIEGNHIHVTLFINESVKLPKDSLLTPMQESMLGGKYAGVVLGSSKDFLKANEIIKTKKALAGIDQASDSMAKAADEFKAFIVDFRKVFDDSSRASLKNTFHNLEAITHELKEFAKLERLNKTADNFNAMAVNLSKTGEKFAITADTINTKLPSIMNNLDKLVQDLKFASMQLKNKIPTLADKFSQVGEDLQNIIEENKKPLHATISSADTFFSSGEDTFRKVENLLDAIDKVQLEVSMRGEWNAGDQYTKGFLSLDYKPSDTKSYKFDVVGMEDYSRLGSDNELIKPKLHEASNLLISAQIAKRYDDVTLRAGLIESTFGAGFDYYMLQDALKTSAEVFDYNAENDVRGTNPHAKISARYTLLKHLDLYGGVDNFLNKDASNLFMGVGVRFYDDDLKTLIMSQSVGSFAK